MEKFKEYQKPKLQFSLDEENEKLDIHEFDSKLNPGKISDDDNYEDDFNDSADDSLLNDDEIASIEKLLQPKSSKSYLSSIKFPEPRSNLRQGNARETSNEVEDSNHLFSTNKDMSRTNDLHKFYRKEKKKESSYDLSFLKGRLDSSHTRPTKSFSPTSSRYDSDSFKQKTSAKVLEHDSSSVSSSDIFPETFRKSDRLSKSPPRDDLKKKERDFHKNEFQEKHDFSTKAQNNLLDHLLLQSSQHGLKPSSNKLPKSDDIVQSSFKSNLRRAELSNTSEHTKGEKSKSKAKKEGSQSTKYKKKRSSKSTHFAEAQSSSSSESSSSSSTDAEQSPSHNVHHKSKKASSRGDFLSSLLEMKESKSPRLSNKGTKKKNNVNKSIPSVQIKKKVQRRPKQERPDSESALAKASLKHEDDLLELFEKVKITEQPQTNQETLNAGGRCVQSSVAARKKDSRSSSVKREFALHLAEHVANSVALYDYYQEYIDSDDSEGVKPKSISKRKSTKKWQKPPAGYQGLGSLSHFQQLRAPKSGEQDHFSTTALRKAAYMHWLAYSENSLKERKKQQKLEEKKENETKQKEKNEKILENKSARKAWLNIKEALWEDEKNKRKIEMQNRRTERERLEEEKWKASIRANVAREKLIDRAREQHRLNLKIKKENEMIQMQKNEDLKRARKCKLTEWREKKEKLWEEDRQRKLEEERRKTRDLMYEKRHREKEKRNFQNWKRKKDREQRFEKGKIKYHEEDRPPWYPTSETIFNRTM